MSFIICFSYGEIAFQGIVNLKTCREIELETERLDDMLVIRKEEPKKGHGGGGGGAYYSILNGHARRHLDAQDRQMCMRSATS